MSHPPPGLGVPPPNYNYNYPPHPTAHQIHRPLPNQPPPPPSPPQHQQPTGSAVSDGSNSDSQEPPAKVPRTRISRACENCRARRKKCQPPYPCKACRDAGLPDCLVRERARPTRRRRSQQASSAPIEGSTFPRRTKYLDFAADELEQLYMQKTGTPISLKLEEKPTHPLCDLKTPLPPLPNPLPAELTEAMQVFLDDLLPWCSYMTPPRVHSLFNRYVTSPETLSPDQTALICACLALGLLRLKSVPLRKHFHRHHTEVPDEERLDVVFFRHAIDILERWGTASFTSLHALSTISFYTCLTCTSDVMRMTVAWMVSQAKDLGIHQEQTANAQAYTPSDRADLMFVQVVYSHFWAAALSGKPPMIKPGEFISLSVQYRSVSEDTDIAIVPRRPMVEILLLNTQLFSQIWDSKNPTMSMDWMLRMEERWDNWISTWIGDGQTSGLQKADYFIFGIWEWGRLALRLMTMNDRRVSVASMAMMARSASKIIEVYYSSISSEMYNCMWTQLRQITTCAHVVLFLLTKYEIRKPEAEDLLSKACWILDLWAVRWKKQAADARSKILIVAQAFGLDVPIIHRSDSQWAGTPHSHSEHSHTQDHIEPSPSSIPVNHVPPPPMPQQMPPPPQLPQPLPPLPPPGSIQPQFDLRNLGFLYEAFDPASQPNNQPQAPWGFDNIWLSQDYV